MRILNYSSISKGLYSQLWFLARLWHNFDASDRLRVAENIWIIQNCNAYGHRNYAQVKKVCWTSRLDNGPYAHRMAFLLFISMVAIFKTAALVWCFMKFDPVAYLIYICSAHVSTGNCRQNGFLFQKGKSVCLNNKCDDLL